MTQARGRAPRADARPLAALAAAAAALVVPLYLIAVQTGWGQRLDQRASGELVQENQRVLRAAESFLHVISVGSLAAFGTTLVLVALVRGRIPLALATATAILGANGTTQLLKRTLERPDLAGGHASEPPGFPSGHATVAMSLALALVLVSPPALRTAAAALGALYAAAVGVAVIGLGWHRPSDVAGAYLVATAWAAASAALVRRHEAREREPVGPPAVSARATGGVALVAAAAFLVVVAVAATRDRDLAAAAAVHTSLVVLSVLAILAGLALVAAFTALLGGRSAPGTRPAG